MRTTKAELLELKQEIEAELEKLKSVNELYQRNKKQAEEIAQWHTKQIFLPMKSLIGIKSAKNNQKRLHCSRSKPK
ncbi:Uncharacterised protein [[Pasteurella] mairii]|uniref:Uncharacterized protein n=1 Tax=[Pasteurella] mairii TaxID=757 RepID=A0A379B0C5_9PAST|nr:Uncharacterised protein [[Pasteurella] mairii]